MPWTKDDYPESMKNLLLPVREKAVEIANALLEEGYEEESAIPIAISQAKEWAENRGIANTLDGKITGSRTKNIDDSDEQNIYTNVAGETRKQRKD